MSEGYNTPTLILYHTVVQQQWHETMKGQGNPFNLSIFNQRLYDMLSNQIRDQMASKFLKNCITHRLTNIHTPTPPSHTHTKPFAIQCNAMQRDTPALMSNSPNPTQCPRTASHLSLYIVILAVDNVVP